MTPQQLDLDLAGLEIEALELIPVDEVDELAGGHGVTEIGASCLSDSCRQSNGV